MSNLPWFKLYTESRVDKKLSILTLAERGVWINLLCYASEQPERGTFDAADIESLAVECAEGETAILQSALEKLLKVRHILVCNPGLYETSETSGNDGNEYVTTKNSFHSFPRYIFRTFASRQAQKVSNYPSDAPGQIKVRVRKHRALKKQAQLDGSVINIVTSETSGNDTDREVEEEKIFSSGKVNTNTAVEGAPARPAASASGSMNVESWTETEVKRVAKRIAGRLKLINPDMTGLEAVLQQRACAPPYLEAEAAKCLEWHSAKGRKVTIRLFDNWLAKAATRQELERQQQLQALNGTNGNAYGKGSTNYEQQQSTTNGRREQSTTPTTNSPAEIQELRERRKLLADFFGTSATG